MYQSISLGLKLKNVMIFFVEYTADALIFMTAILAFY